MRVMMMLKADRNSEAGVQPSAEELQKMGQLMEDMAKAGVLLAGEGLTPSSKGKRIRFSGGKVVRVTDGPFTETKELIAGFAMMEAKSWDEVMMWAERFAEAAGEGESELRPLYESTDFENFTREEAARENELREELKARR